MQLVTNKKALCGLDWIRFGNPALNVSKTATELDKRRTFPVHNFCYLLNSFIRHLVFNIHTCSNSRKTTMPLMDFCYNFDF